MTVRGEFWRIPLRFEEEANDGEERNSGESHYGFSGGGRT